MEKIYCGSGKEVLDGDMIKVSLCLSKIPKEHTFMYKGETYVKLNVRSKKKEDQYGKTHSVTVDTWKPGEKKEEAKTEVKPSSIPF